MAAARPILFAVALSSIFALAACESTPEGNESLEVIETPNAAAEVATFTTTATVTNIDAAKRKITLKSADGRTATCKAGPDVTNFDQIKVGDTVIATVTEEFAIMLTSSGKPLTAADRTTVALAPIGAKPGAYIADCEMTRAQVQQVWPKERKIRLQFVDGSSRTIKVGKNVDLQAIPVGDDVTVQVAESLALVVEKP